MYKLPFDYMNAAGYAKSVEHVKELVKVPWLTHVVIGGFTVAARDGNTGGTVFAKVGNNYYNSLGLPNRGKEWLRANLHEIVYLVHAAGKKLVLNVSGDNKEEYLELALLAWEWGVDVVEFNLSCPNKFKQGGAQAKMFAFDIIAMDELKQLLAKAPDLNRIEQWWKLSPYTDPVFRAELAAFIATTSARRITLTNTIPNVRPRDEDGAMLITAHNTAGRAGLSGEAIRELTQSNVEHFRELLPLHIGINGVGGIDSGTVLEQYRRLGCAGMQIAGAFMWGENLRALGDIAHEWVNHYYMEEADPA